MENIEALVGERIAARLTSASDQGGTLNIKGRLESVTPDVLTVVAEQGPQQGKRIHLFTRSIVYILEIQ